MCTVVIKSRLHFSARDEAHHSLGFCPPAAARSPRGGGSRQADPSPKHPGGSGRRGGCLLSGREAGAVLPRSSRSVICEEARSCSAGLSPAHPFNWRTARSGTAAATGRGPGPRCRGPGRPPRPFSGGGAGPRGAAGAIVPPPAPCSYLASAAGAQEFPVMLPGRRARHCGPGGGGTGPFARSLPRASPHARCAAAFAFAAAPLRALPGAGGRRRSRR